MKYLSIIIMFFSPQAFSETQTVYLAGGCFWCVEADLEKVSGIKEVISGYSGGDKRDPSYKDVSSGKTQHREAVKVVFDDQEISYKQILEKFLKTIDPTDDGGQFVDRGRQYSPAIYFQSEKEREQARSELSKIKNKFKKPLKVSVEKFKSFYKAEEYHQDYYKKSYIKYKYYRYRSGRDQFLDKYWK